MSLRTLNRARRTRGWFGLLAILVFGLKALVPAGYMIAAVDGHARLVMCPAGLAHAGSMHHSVGMPAIAGMELSAGLNHAAHAQLAAYQCPFALAGGAGLLARAPVLILPYFLTLQRTAVPVVPSAPIAPPLRHLAPRGPPALA